MKTHISPLSPGTESAHAEHRESIYGNHCFAVKTLHTVQIVSFTDILVSHYGDVIMGTMASQITSLTIVYSSVYSGADQRKHQSSASLVFVRGIHRGLVNSPHNWPVTRKMFPFDDVIMQNAVLNSHLSLCKRSSLSKFSISIILLMT